ncbi:MAG: undecaprenyldiphospho-muramoylpentapeptide beta-N-acetylglucosaminyltransferase [Candidatus Firestonebacteria bacterium]
MKKAIITGGGSGGHVFPALAVAKLLKAAGFEAVFAGTAEGIEKQAAEKEGLRFVAIASGKFYRRLTLRNIASIYKVIKGVGDSMRMLAAEKPDVVIGFGGYVSFPVVVSARLLGIKTALHEQNVFPGLANRFLSRFVALTLMTFADAGIKLGGRKVLTGIPVRSRIGQADREAALKSLGLNSGLKTVAVVGGSLGGRGLNKAVIEALPYLKEKNIQLVWVTGLSDFSKCNEAGKRADFTVVTAPFIERIEEVYAAADLMVIRCGASLVFEALKCALPSVLVPFPYSAADHQKYNAGFVAGNGAGVMLQEKELSGGLLAETITGLLGDEKKLKEMSAAAKRLYGKDAGPEIIQAIKGLVC